MAGNLKEEIAAANDKFMACFDSADFEGLSKLYTPDCRVMPTGMDTLIGPEGVKAVFGGANKAGAKKVVLAIVEVGELDTDFNMAYERSEYTFLKEDGAVFDKGKYVVIWKRIDGIWYLYTDIFNTSK